MHSYYEYIVTEQKESADDILKFAKNEVEKGFLKFTSYLEDTITHIKISLKLYDDLISLYLFQYDCNNIGLMELLVSLCQSITMSFSRIIQSNNKCSLYKYLNFCNNNNIVNLKSNKDGIAFYKFDEIGFGKLQLKKSNLEAYFDRYLKIIRNKLYAHSDKMVFQKEKFDNLFDSIHLSDLNGIIDEIISILNDVWMMYRNKKLSFDIKSETNDIDTLINKLKM